MRKRLLSSILVLCMLLTFLPSAAFADEAEDEIDEPAVVQEDGEDEGALVPDGETGEEDASVDGETGEEDASVDRETVEEVTLVETYVPFDTRGNNDELFAGYVSELFPGLFEDDDAVVTAQEVQQAAEEELRDIVEAENELTFTESYSNDASLSVLIDTALDNNSKVLYDLLKEQIQLIADGSLSSSQITISGSALSTKGVTIKGTASDYSTWVSTQFPKRNNILYALLAECPYALYWFDKTGGMGSSAPGNAYNDGSFEILEFVFYFDVADSYQASTVTTVTVGGKNYVVTPDTAKTSAAKTAAANAGTVVSSNAGKSDYQKLLAYKTYICGQVSYNATAANNASTPYGDPWQLIYVFDNSSETNVVCEGYAKAFQYLCDLSTFTDSNLECYTVTGTMSGGTGAGAHMWNIVTMDNEANYLVDVTNCDSGTIGYNDGGAGDYLFLKGMTENATAQSYSKTISGATITYTYDSTPSVLYGTSMLTLSSSDYAPTVATITVNGLTAPVTSAAVDTSATLTADSGTMTVSSISWYASDSDVALGSTATYAGNKVYRAEIAYTLEDAKLPAGSSSATVTADGASSATYTATSDAAGTITVTFPQTVAADVSSVAVTRTGTDDVAVPLKTAGSTTVNLTATATYSDSSTSDVTSEATWTVTAPATPTGLSVSGGVLTITNEAAAGTVTVQATYSGQSSTINITLTKEALAPVSLSISGADSLAATTSAANVNYAVSGVDQYGAEMASPPVTWNVSENDASVTINSSTGVLSVPASCSNTSVTITATYGASPNQVTATKTVTITREASSLTSVTAVASGSLTVPTITSASQIGQTVTGDTTVTMTATVKDQFDTDITSSAAVAWSIDPAYTGVSINETTGVLSVTNEASAGTVKVYATASYGTDEHGAAITKKSGAADVTVEKTAAAATYVQILNGSSVLAVTGTSGADTILIPTVGTSDNVVTYTAKVFDQYGASSDATPSWSNTSSLTSVTVSNNQVTVAAGAAEGSFALTATADENTAVVTITVSNYPKQTLSGTLENKTVAYGGTLAAQTVTNDMASNSGAAVAYTSSDTSVVTVDSSTGAVTIAGVGTATITAQAPAVASTYSASDPKTYTVTVTARDITGSAITASGIEESYTYTGSQITPSSTPALSDSGATITTGDYDVSYGANVNVSTGGSVIFTGKGNYTGTKTVTFTITAKEISDSDVSLASGTWTYNGSAQEPTVTVTGLTQGTDYTLQYSDNIDAGEAKATVTGTGNYTGTVEKTFTIGAKSLTGAVTFSDIADQPYTGSAITPSFIVTDDALTTQLTAGTDYTAAYTGNTDTGSSATITITGSGNYTGTETKTFTITAGTLTASAVTKTLSYKETSEQSVAITEFAIQNSAGTAVTPDSVTVGTVTGDTEILSGSVTYVSGAVKFTLDSVTAAAGKTVVVPLTIKKANYAVKAVNLTITTTDQYTPTLTATDYTKTYDGQVVAESAITKTAAYNGSNVDGTWELLKTVDDTSQAAPTDVAGSGSYVLKFTPTDSTNYAGGTTAVTITINKAPLTITANSKSATVGDTAPVLSNTDYTVSGFVNSETSSVLTGLDSIQIAYASVPDMSVAGTTAINITGTVTADNYGVTLQNGALTVSLAPVTPSTPTIPSTPTTPSRSSGDSSDSGYTAEEAAAVSAASGGGSSGGISGSDPTDTTTESAGGTFGSGTPTVSTTSNTAAGTTTETTTYSDGSSSVTQTASDGSSTTTNTTSGGVTGTTETDSDGNVTSIEATVPASAAEESARTGNPVTIPVEASVAPTTATATEIDISVNGGESAKVEIPVDYVTPGTVAVLVRPDGTEEIIKTSTTTAGGVIIPVDGDTTVKLVDNSKDFADVRPGDWFSDYVDWASSREVLNGTGGDSFSPNESVSRAQTAQMLANLAGANPAPVEGQFSDVPGGQWYGGAVSWVVANGFMSGFPGGTFGPNENVTREQLAMVLYAYAEQNYGVRGGVSLNRFSDGGRTSDWARVAMSWAVGNGLFSGNADGTLNPTGSATRAELSAIMQNFCKNIVR